MCGFIGEISNTLLEPEKFKSLLDLSVQRGPDSQGMWNDEICQLGFNRLAILDISEKGNQPLLTPSGRFAMVFNGEIYNYKELQKNHGIKEEQLRSKSDSEILAQLLEIMTVHELAKVLNGMFAIAVYDLQRQEIHLLRDFAGIKPLYYGLHSKGIVFASQFDQVFKHPLFSDRNIRPEIMKEFLALGYMHAPNTVFETIFQVKPGEHIIWSYPQKQINSQTNFWKWHVTNTLQETDGKATAQFEVLFQKVIKDQLVADVQVASFLSGGIDSPLVTGFAADVEPNIVAFTLDLDDTKLNESQQAKQFAQLFGVNQVIEKLHASEIVAMVDNHFKGMPEPFGDYSSLPTYLLTQRAVKTAKVMLSGDGGDELFWGYPRFSKSVEQSGWFRWPFWLRKILIPLLRRIKSDLSSALENINRFDEWILHKQIHFPMLNQLMPNSVFSRELKQTYTYSDALSKERVLQFLKKNEYDAHMQRTLRKVDLCSMANSLEVRVPFLDKQIIEFSNRIQPQLKRTHNTPKYVLRSALKKRVPEELVNLPKKGFSVPIKKWLKNDLKDDVINTLLKQPFYGLEHIEESYLHKCVNDFFENKNNINPWGIWHLYAWQKWAYFHKLI